MAIGNGLRSESERRSEEQTAEDANPTESSPKRALMGAAVLVSLIAVLGMLRGSEKANAPVLWSPAPFQKGVVVTKVEFRPEEKTATVTIDAAGWRGLAPAQQKAIGQTLAGVAAPHGADEIRITDAFGMPLATGTTASMKIMPPPPAAQ
jgi:hypothetical protein